MSGRRSGCRMRTGSPSSSSSRTSSKERSDTGQPLKRANSWRTSAISVVRSPGTCGSRTMPRRRRTALVGALATPADDGLGLLRSYAAARQLRLVERALELTNRTVVWIESDWDGLQALPFTSIPLAEIRKPEFVQTIEDLDLPDQEELAEDLSERLELANDDAPAVCHLDSGVRRSHVLLSGSLSVTDVHSVVPGSIGDTRNHGTPMAGLGLLGPLDDPLLTASITRLRHRLESVKILPDSTQDAHDPLAYGLVTAEAVSMPEATALRPRVFCMPITTPSERPGEPTLWSASVDALAAGVDIAASDGGISLLGARTPTLRGSF